MGRYITWKTCGVSLFYALDINNSKIINKSICELQTNSNTVIKIQKIKNIRQNN